MILRAIFWVALVSVLMPHEPDLGFGRPHVGGGSSLTSHFHAWAREAAAHSGRMCEGREASCVAGLSFLDSFQSVALRSLADVKADIDQNRRERSRRTPSA